MLYDLNDSLFLRVRGMWFLWEPAWEHFRPIESVAWDGTAFRVHDDLYCSDPTDPLYGYGSAQMRELCELLHDKRNDPVVKVASLPIGTEWFRDRFVALSPCAPRTPAGWKRMVRTHGRTCRKCPRGKTFTRRTLPVKK